jgi:hypothetical protein
VQVAEQDIADLWRQNTDSFQHIVQVGLGNPGAAGEPPFGQFAALHAVLYVGNQPELERFKVHEITPLNDFALK